MNPKIDRDELEGIVEEAARLQEEDRTLYDASEAKQVLAELDLPAERLDEARLALSQRREAARAKKKRRLAVAAAALVVAALAGTTLWYTQSKRDALGAMRAAEATVTAGAARDVALDVILSEPPRGSAVDLSCEWKGPSGAVVYENRWTTKEISHDHWPTRCRRSFGAQDQAGRWSVTMKQGDRELTTKDFALE